MEIEQVLKELLTTSKKSLAVLRSIDKKLLDLRRIAAANNKVIPYRLSKDESAIETMVYRMSKKNNARLLAKQKESGIKPIKTKKLLLHKDPAYIAKLKRQFIEDHNKKIRNKQQRSGH